MLPPAPYDGYGALPSMKRLLVGLGTGTYCIQAAAVFHGSETEGLLLTETPKMKSRFRSTYRSAYRRSMLSAAVCPLKLPSTFWTAYGSYVNCAKAPRLSLTLPPR